jgi:hypothetical protein
MASELPGSPRNGSTFGRNSTVGDWLACDGQDFFLRRLAPSVGLPQHPDENRPKDSILLAVDQELGEGAALR